MSLGGGSWNVFGLCMKVPMEFLLYNCGFGVNGGKRQRTSALISLAAFLVSYLLVTGGRTQNLTKRKRIITL